MLLTGNQIRRARQMADLSQQDLAKAARTSFDTIKRLERAKDRSAETSARILASVQAVLEKAGAEFFITDGIAGVRFSYAEPYFDEPSDPNPPKLTPEYIAAFHEPIEDEEEVPPEQP